MSDKRGPTWVDYGNLAANVFQVAQLSAVSSRLRQLEQIEAAREERMILENELRQFIFELEEGVDRLCEYGDKAPRGVVTTLLLIETTIDKAEVFPATFQQFVDKDRVRTFKKKVSELEELYLSSLKPEEKEKIDWVMKRAPHREGLHKLIAALEAKANLDKTEKQWQELEGEKRSKVRIWDILMFSVFSISLVAIPVLFLLSVAVSGNSSELGALFQLICCFGVSGAMAGIVIGLIGRSNAIPKEYGQLEQLRRTWLSQLLPKEYYDQVISIFGSDLELGEYKKIEERISQFLSEVLEHDKDGALLPQSLIKVAIPKLILGETPKKAQ
jgi:hypothetical protein